MSDQINAEEAKQEDSSKVQRDDEMEARKAKAELSEAIRGSHEIIDTATTVWPFNFFPDTVTVDREKITINNRRFFQVAKIISINMTDVLNVTANVGPFFGSLHIVSRVLTADKPYEVNYLWRDDALRLKRILQGYIIALQKEVDVSPLTTDELRKVLNELGLGNPPQDEN